MVFFQCRLPIHINALHVQDAVALARTGEEPEIAARKLTETAFTRGSADNITCIVVRFHHVNEDPAEPEVEQE